MKKLLLFVCIVCSISLSAQQVAFPGAEGFGKYATGGRTGTVYHVTNLNDSGTGSFRDAISRSNRIIVFDVAGVIKITSTLVVSSNVYIAGQTAPGEGITIYGDRTSFSGADNTICRYMRFRMGVIGSSGKDAMGIANGKNMIFDHVSVSWGRDETFSINWDGKGSEPTNITIQNSIVSQGLLLHSAGGLIQTNGGVTLYRNLYVDNSTRNNKVKGVSQYVNNLVYNWKNGAYIMGGDSEGSSYVNVVGNYFVKGPDKGGTPISDGNSSFHIYADDNWHDNNLDGELNGYEIPKSEYSGGPDFQDAPFDYPVLPTITANELFANLLPVVGASLPYRDLADYYVVNEMKSFGTEGELISSESSLPIGAPTSWNIWTGSKRIDTDKDGMPDNWETDNGLNPNSATDAMTIVANGYTNLENYINGIDGDWSQEHIRTPLNFAVQSATQSTITFEWLDYTEREDGYIIQRLENGSYVDIATTAVDADSYTVTGLEAEESGSYRVYGFNASTVSDYSNVIVAKSRPVEIPVLDPVTFIPDVIWGAQVNDVWDKSTQNWLSGTDASLFADDKSVLFNDAVLINQDITITEAVSPTAVFVKSDSDYVFSGTSSITGAGSVNKTGSGKLSLLSNNTYTGGTVVWDGTLEVNKLANGGLPSSIGASQNYAFNWVMKGGKVNYTGGSVSTDRNIALDVTSELGVSSSSTTLTMAGSMTGAGGFVKSGNGTLNLSNNIGNTYEGPTTIAGGTVNVDLKKSLNLSNVLGSSNLVKLAGGTLKTTNGQSSNYEVYDIKIMVPEGTTGGFAPYRNCYIKSAVSGSGTLNYTIPYLREYIQGDWSLFTGVLNANGSNPTGSGGSQFLLNNTVGLPYARVNLSGNAKIINWATTGTMSLGGLSGVSGTVLGCASKKTDGTRMLWKVGGASTDETFRGIINNDCSADKHYGITSIIKEGTGIWTLTGSNVYSGTTIVSGGTLVVNGSHTGTGLTTVKEDSKLAGKGRLRGTVKIESGAVLEPGDNGIGSFYTGSLIFNDGAQVDMEINRTTMSYDRIAAGGSVSYNGTLNLLIDGTLVAGDKFTLFTGTGHSGSFSEIIPEKPGEGLHWEFNNGVLSVELGTAVKNVLKETFTVYPNPAKDNIQIVLNQKYDNISLKVQTIDGSDLICKTCTNADLFLDISGLSNGLYLLSVEADGKPFQVAKFIKH